MTETTESDPMAFNDEQSAPEPPEAPKEESFGDGIMGDTFDEDSSEGTGHPESAEAAEKPNTDNQPAESEEDRAGRLRYEDYTRKTQELSNLRREFEQQQQEFQRRQQEWLEKQQQALQQPQAQDVPLSQQLAQVMNSGDLSPQDRAGLSVIQQVVQANEELRKQVDELAQFRQTVEPQFQETAQTLQQLTQKEQAQMRQKLTGEVEEAKRLFGEDTVQQAGEFIRRTYGTQKPGSEDTYSIPELVAMATGRSLEDAKRTKEANRGVRSRAQKSAANVGSDNATSDKPYLTRDEVLAQW